MPNERIEELKVLTVTQLRQMCKDMGITGLSRGKEMECIEAIIKKEQEIETQMKGTEKEKKEDDNPKNKEENTEFDEAILIQRTSKCGNYRAKIKGVSEAARRSGVTPEQVVEALGNGKSVNGWTFKEVE